MDLGCEGYLPRSIQIRVLHPQIGGPDHQGLDSPICAERDAAAQALAIAGENVSGCAELALRFCLSIPGISSVLAGVRSIDELEANVTAAERGPLAPKIVDQLCNLDVADEKLLNPRNWAELI